MAAQSRRSSSTVVEQLEHEGHRFEFFQAVRLLQRLVDQQDAKLGRRLRQPIGHDAPPDDEPIRFSTTLSSSFPSSAIAAINLENTLASDNDKPARVAVNFMGLTGPQGVLPEHFHRLLIEQHRANNDLLAEFQDLFNHRMISQFYRAWEKCHFPARYERAQLDHESQARDPFTQCLLGLVGMGTEGLCGRQSFDDQAYVYYGGHFASQIRNADSLADVLTDDLDIPVRIEQFQGQWLALSQDDRVRLVSINNQSSEGYKLGHNTVLGSSIWDVQSRFRVVLGPLSYTQYMRLVPGGESFIRLCEMTRSYVGLQFDFDIQPILRIDQIPVCKIGRSADTPRLGHNTFLGCQEFDQDFHGAVFHSVDHASF